MNKHPLNLTPPETSLEHLQLALAQIDLRLRREVHRWQLANQDPSDAFRGFAVGHADAAALLNRPFGTSWGQTVNLNDEELSLYEKSITQAKKKTQAYEKKLAKQSLIPRLSYVAQAFALDDFEVDTLLICLAPTLDLRYESLYGYLQDHVARKRPTVNLVLNLLGTAGASRLRLLDYFAEDASLLKHHLLKCVSEPGQGEAPLLSQTLVVDKTLTAWLGGQYTPNPDLGLHLTYIPAQTNQVDLILTSAVEGIITNIQTNNPVLAFYGPDGGRQQATAQTLAAQLKRNLLVLDLGPALNDGLAPRQAVQMALRDARLIGAVPALFGWEACLVDKKTPADLLHALCAFPDMVIVGGAEKWQVSQRQSQRPFYWQEFDIPAYLHRRELWTHFLNVSSKKKKSALAGAVNNLANQFYLTTAQIQDATITAQDMALQRGDGLNQDDLFAAARSHSSTHLADLAQKITPRYDWADIVLPEDQLTLLHEVVDTMKGRSVVLEAWGVGQKLAASRGLAVLFGGPPGTGKTMAAEVIAHNLGLDLYKIDLSTIISKYIGETEKNLERIFREAETSNAILFFDEADSLFGKRSEVRDSHDRYANIETSYLLQRMEAYNGVTILATNLRANLDEAFTRRLHFAVSFPFPDEDDRERIWETLFPATIPRHTDINFRLMAERFKLAGGNIRNIIVNAAYLAAGDESQTQAPEERQVAMHHLLHSTARELQKMGRLVKEEDMRLR